MDTIFSQTTYKSGHSKLIYRFFKQENAITKTLKTTIQSLSSSANILAGQMFAASRNFDFQFFYFAKSPLLKCVIFAHLLIIHRIFPLFLY